MITGQNTEEIHDGYYWVKQIAQFATFRRQNFSACAAALLIVKEQA